MKKTAVLLITLLMLLAAFCVCAETSGSFEYTVNEDGTATITAYNDDVSTDVVIPDQIDGHTVTAIGRSAFYGKAALVNITLPDTLVTIGDYAFYMCKNVYSIALPDSVTAVGDHAFAACARLKYVTLSAGLTVIEPFTFASCTALESVTIPEGVEEIGTYAFSCCSRIKSAIIPQSIRTVGRFAFSSCPKLTIVILPANIESLDAEAFAYSRSVNLQYSTEAVANSEAPAVTLTVAIVGDYLTFGSYEQDGNTANGPEPIEWLVLEVNDRKALLISRYVLDAAPYNSKEKDVTWEKCSLRTWLNSTFLTTAFNGNEMKSIVTVKVDNGSNQGNQNWNTKGGSSTQDQIFLLSFAEMQMYFANNDARAAQITAYARSNGVNRSDDGSWYWMRSPGKANSNAAIVKANGSIGSFYGVDYKNGGVRPALWISLENTAQ